MSSRRSFHDCASELLTVSHQFREAYFDRAMLHRDRMEALDSSSSAGLELLDSIALGVRRHQDYSSETGGPRETPVGALKARCRDREAGELVRTYAGPFTGAEGLSVLTFREGLNKIAHYDQSRCSFWATPDEHELLLVGDRDKRQTWFAALSVQKLCEAIFATPDRPLGDVSKG